MNNQIFRVIFSRTLQRLVVTSELAKSAGKAHSESTGGLGHQSAVLKPLIFSLYCALGFVAFSSSALAETLIIKADPNAPKSQQPIILQTANGLPQVNIQTPNDKGLSHNKYHDFNVAEKGAILNNSRKATQTQQAGLVQGNPYLARGEAKVILNEVTSNNPSVMKGYVEVAGKKAEVIIANPNGLHCDGCGIINADRATITTGKPQIHQGDIDSYRVEKGKVKVSSKGMDNSRVDYTDILAREAEINAGIWTGKKLNVVTGQNQIKRGSTDQDLQINHIKTSEKNPQNTPHFALDVSELGGMYAGKIHLVGTEQGLGVRNAGHIGASAETLVIDSQGRVVNSGTLNAQGEVNITAQHGVSNTGKIENRQGNIRLNSQGDIQQDGSIVARGGEVQGNTKNTLRQKGETVAKNAIRYRAKSIEADKTALLAAGVSVNDTAQGEVRTLSAQSAQGADITIQADEKATLQGRHLAAGKVQLTASEVDLNHSQTSAYGLNVKAAQGEIQANHAVMIVEDNLNLTTPTWLQTQASYLRGKKITTEQRTLDTRNAVWEQTGKDPFTLEVAGTLENKGGQFKTQGDFTIKSQGVNNREGSLIANGKLSIYAGKGQVDSTGGALLAADDLNITSGALINNHGVIQSNQNVTLHTQGQALFNQQTLTNEQNKGIVALGTLTLHAADVHNQQGRILAKQALNLSAQQIANQQGDMRSVESVLDINTHQQTFNNQAGKLYAKSTLSINSGTLENTQGAILSEQDISLNTHAHALINQDTQSSDRGIIALGKLGLQSAEFDNQQGYLASGDHLTLSAKSVGNTDGVIQSGQGLKLIADEVSNHRGLISVKTTAEIAAHNSFAQTQGQLGASELNLKTGYLKSEQQSLITADRAHLQVSGQFDHQQSRLNTLEQLTIQSQALNNRLGIMNSVAGNVNIHTQQQQLDNTQGQITAKGDVLLDTGALDNRAGLIHGQQTIHIDTHAQRLINQQTQGKNQGILANGRLTLRAGEVDNTQGTIVAKSDMVTVNTPRLLNQSGILQSGGDLSLQTQRIENSQGLISGVHRVDLTATDGLLQAAGKIGAGELVLNAGTLQSTENSLISVENATVNVTHELVNAKSEISATKQIRLISQALNNQQGLLLTKQGDIAIDTQLYGLDNQQGKILAGQGVTIDSGAFNNQFGEVVGKTGMALNTHRQTLNNQAGKLLSQRHLTIRAGELTNEQGYIQATQQADIQLGSATLNNRLGVIASGTDLRLTAGTVHNDKGDMSARHLNAEIAHLYQQNGAIQTDGRFILRASGEVLSTHYSRLSGEEIDIQAGGQLDNAQSEIIAKNQGTIRSQQLNNTAGALVAEQGDLTIDTQKQQVVNQQGKLSAGNRLSIQSGELDNQQGLIQSRVGMVIHTHQGNLNNQNTQGEQQGIISLGTLALTTQQLLNQTGYLLSQADQTLHTQSIDNTRGVLASFGNQTLDAKQHIRNNSGRISGETTHITAQSLDNQAGLVQGNAELDIQVQGALNNQQGQVKGKNRVEIVAGSVDNSMTGQIRAVEGRLSLSSVGQLNNAQGYITAQQQAILKAQSLNNQQGTVYNEQGSLDVAIAQHLDNQQGRVIGKDKLRITSQSLLNQQGALYAETQGNLHITGRLDNQQNGKIHGLGDMAIEADYLDNRGGEIRAQETLDLRINTAIDNQKVAATGSFIESGNKLILHTQSLNNAQTRAASETMTQGILASEMTLSAQRVNNQQGKIHVRTQGHLNIAQVLENQLGDITGGALTIEGKALGINNQNGRLQAERGLSITVDHVSTDGHLEGQDIHIRQQKDFVTNAGIHADRSLTISTAGDVINRHQLYADERVHLSGRHITNEVNGRISSAYTHLTAKEDLTNEGLINSVSADENGKTVLQVGGKLLNTGKGRIYGDHIALEADVIENRDKAYDKDNILSAVVASRGRLDLAAREIYNQTDHYLSDNQTGAMLFSVGEMTLGRRLNSEHRAQGKADALYNNSSIIETESGGIALNITRINNKNIHFDVEHVQTGKAPTDITKRDEKKLNQTYIVPMGSNERHKLEDYHLNPLNGDNREVNIDNPYIPMSLLRWAGWSRAGQLVYKGDGAEPVVLKPGDVITPDTPLAIRDEMHCEYSNGKESCAYIPAGQYGMDSPIWAHFGVEPPQEPQPPFPFDDLVEQPWFVQEEWFTEDNEFIPPKKPSILKMSPAEFEARWVKWSYYVKHIRPLENWERKYQTSLEAVDKGIEEHNKKRLGALADKHYRSFWQLHFNHHRVDESTVLKTVPGQILAGGKLAFDSESFVNDRSVVIAGQTLSLKEDIENIDEEGLHRVTDSGRKVFTFGKWRGGFRRYIQRRWENSGEYVRQIETPFDMHIFRVEENVNYGDNKRADDSLKNKVQHTLVLSDVNAQADALSAQGLLGLGALNTYGAGAFTSIANQAREVEQTTSAGENGQTVNPTPLTGALEAFHALDSTGEKTITPMDSMRQLTRIELNAEQEVRSIQPNLVIPNNVLYRLNAAPNSGVLVETDPDFTQQKRWLSTDYMFNALRYEPNQSQKRLGDGFYEQRLVREQINRLTGRHGLGHNQEFEAQYRRLMDAGVTFAQQFNLRPGIRLSPSQVAQLTSDIVWLENESVRLPNGEIAQVLVPKVYAVVKKDDVTGNGTLLSGQQVTHQGGNVENSGTILGRELVRFDSESIRNTGNISGDAIIGQIKGNMDNIGGSLEADKGILLNIAGNFTHSSTTHTSQSNVAGHQRTDTIIGRKGLLHVKGEDGVLQINANNIDIQGADILNEGQGQTRLTAKNQLNLTALSVGFDEKLGGGNHYRHEQVSEAVTARIKGQGDVVLQGRDIYSEGAKLDAQKRLVALAENDVVLDGAKNSTHFEESHRYKSGSGLSRSRKETFDSVSREFQQGTTLVGSSIHVSAGHDVKGRGLGALATEGDIVIQAKNNLTLDSDTNTLNETHWEKRKKSGLSGSLKGGVAEIGIGTSREKKQETGAQTQLSQSHLIAQQGNLTLVAKNQVNLSSVVAEADKDIHIQGAEVSILAATESQQSQYKHEQRSAGVGTNMVYNPVQLAKSLYSQREQEGATNSLVGKSVTGEEVFRKTLERTLNGASPYLRAKRQSLNQEGYQETAIGSELRAGGNLSVVATEGDITMQGGVLTAGGDALFQAKHNVTFDVATNTQHQTAQKRATGGEINGMKEPSTSVSGYHNKNLAEGETRHEQGAVLSIGGKTQVIGQQGNVTFKGTNLVSEGDIDVYAGKDINITTAETRTRQSDNLRNYGRGEAVISETERFSGYSRQINNQDGETVTHSQSRLASLGGKIHAYAGQDFNQKSGQLLAKNKIEISAEQINLTTAHNTQTEKQHGSDLKIGNFSRVSSPIIDLVNTMENTYRTAKDKEASDRLKAADLLGLAAQGYTLNNAVNSVLNGTREATLFRAESGIGYNHSRTDQTLAQSQSLSNSLNSKAITLQSRSGDINLAHTELTSRDEQGNRIQGSRVTLDSANQLNITAGEHQFTQTGRSQSVGEEVGTAFSAGAQTGWSVYGKAGYGNSRSQDNRTTYQNSLIDTEQLNLRSQGETNLTGVTALAKRIDTDIGGNLTIKSLQDQQQQSSSGMNAGVKVEFGFGTAWNLSLSASGNKARSHFEQVGNQSGLFAEEGGYHIQAKNVHLEGGTISSTNPDNSELATNQLTFKDIHNQSRLQAMSASGSAAYGNDTYSGKDITGASPGLPLLSQEHAQSVTKATLTEGNITLNKDSAPIHTSANALGINTDLSKANPQLNGPKDIHKTLAEQSKLSDSVGKIASASQSYASQRAKQAAEKGDTEEAKKWQTGGEYKRNLDMATAILTGALAGQSVESIAAKGASPLVNNAIKQATEGNPEANILAHTLWSAIETHLSGGNALAGAVAGGSAEALAPILAEKLYGKSASELTEAEKQHIVGLSSIAGGILSAATAHTGDTSSTVTTLANAALGADTAKSAVENNFLKPIMESQEQVIQWKLLGEGNNIKKSLEEQVVGEIKEDAVDAIDKYAPHYISLGIQIYGVGGKSAINLRNGDVVTGWSFSSVVLPNRIGLSSNANLGWIANLEPSDLKTVKGERNTGNTITRTIEGNSIGGNACYKLSCIGYSQTITNNKNDKKFHTLEIGIGMGGSGIGIGQERTYKIGNILGNK
ncbi:hemagglutinin repeat-containing protein [Conservatibacter flavescens]|uniref:Heme utilization protein n=1 Tax=Conservatibacter flavescens TaxID=28161 RepID=A0A2M8S4E8_9PAST|nr:hemagglutinin repeat-containing protein [Conservatibacter flavescens]PJG85968.1 heme utilization protein [Conservatibacter flavescens]